MTYDTTMFIEIEGTKAELRALQGIDGLELPRGATDLGGGRFKVRAFVQRKGVLVELQARGVTVRVVRDEADVKGRIDREFESFKRTRGLDADKPDQRPSEQQPSGDQPGDASDKPGRGPKDAG